VRTLSGKIQAGHVVVDAADDLPEGAAVTVVVHEHETFDLDAESLAEIERRIEAANRGDVLEYDDLDELKRDLWSELS